MQIQSLLFREMKEYDDQYIRPFYGDASPRLLNALDDATEGGSDFSPSRLAGVAGHILRPSANTSLRAAITGGWGQQRMMFVMLCNIRTTKTAQVLHEITGYTDHVGIHSGLRGIDIDPHMTLHFTSVTRIGRTYANTPTGNGWLTSINKSNLIIGKQSNPDFTRARGGQGTLTARPEDLFTRNGTNSIFAEQVKRAGGSDMRGGFANHGMKFSNILNNGSTRFMNRSLTALFAADRGDSLDDPYGQDRDLGKIWKEARGKVREDAITSDPIMEELSQDTNILHDNFITYGELMQMDPEFAWDDVPVYLVEKGMRKSVRGDYRPWNGNDNVDIAAKMLVDALPMYLISHQMAHVAFSASNISTLGEIIAVATNASPMMEGPNLREVVPTLMARLEAEILRDILPWPDCSLELEVDTSIAGETYIKISLDRQDFEEFVFPVFSQALVAPVVVENTEFMDNLSLTLSQIGDSLGSQYNNDDSDRPRIITEPGRLDFSQTRGKTRSF